MREFKENIWYSQINSCEDHFWEHFHYDMYKCSHQCSSFGACAFITSSVGYTPPPPTHPPK